MAKSKVLTGKQVSKQIGERKLNPDLIDAALTVLRAMYFGTAYPIELRQALIDGKPLPLGSLILNPKLSDKLSDQLGPVTIPILQKMIEDSAQVSGRVVEVTNKIFDIHNRVTAKGRNVPLGEGPGLKDVFPEVTQLPKIPPPFTGNYVDAATQMVFIDAQIDAERRKERQKLIDSGYQMPEGADMFQSIESIVKIVGESALLADTMTTKNLTMDLALGDKSFQEKRTRLFESMSRETGKLKNDKAMQEYLKTFPIGIDTAMMFFVGAPWGAVVPARELMTMAMVLANDPVVRNQAFKVGTLQEDADWDELYKTANASVTKSILDGKFQKARLFPEIAASIVLTAPTFWEALGMRYPGKNMVWEMFKGIGKTGRSIRQTTNNSFLKTVLGWFEDRETLRVEDLTRQFNSYLQKQMGPKYGKEIADDAMREFAEVFGKELVSSKEKEKTAMGLRELIRRMVQERTAHLTKAEVSAAIMKQQGLTPADIPISLPPAMREEIEEAFTSPFVDDAVDFFREILDRVRKFDPEIPANSLYFPASEARAKTEAELSAFYLRRTYKQARDFVEKVIPDFDNPDNTLDLFVDRVAAPMFEPIIAGTEKTIGRAAGLMMEILEDRIKNPDKVFKDVTRLVGDVPQNKASATAKLISNFQHFRYLTTRFPAWFSTEWFDDGIRILINQWDNMKNGKWPLLSDLKMAQKIPPPPELFNRTFQAGLLDDASRLTLNMFENMALLNRDVFAVAGKGANWRLARNYELNLAGNLNKAKRIYGENLPEEVIERAKKEAVDAAREYQLARRVNSAFMTNGFTRTFAPYLGYYTESMGLLTRELGRSPEIFIGGAALLNNLREMNEELPEFMREAVQIGDRAVYLPQRTSFYPIYRLLEFEKFGPPDTREERNKKDWETLKTIQDPRLRMQIIDRNPGLRKYGETGVAKAIADVFDAAESYRAIPFGGDFKLAMKAFGLVKDKFVNLVPFSKELSQVAILTGIDNLDVEKNIGSIAGFLRSDAYSSDMAIEDILMRYRGEAGGKTKEELREMAKLKIQKKALDDLVFNRTFGMGKRLDPALIDFQNEMSKLFELRNLVVPTEKELDVLKKRYNLNDDQAALVWKNGYDAADLIRRGMENIRVDLRKRMPLLEEYANVTNDKYQKQLIFDMKDRLDMTERVPQDNARALIESDNVVQALISSYGDKDLALSFIAWMGLTPREKLKHLRSSPTDASIIKKYFPDEFEKYRNYLDPTGPVTTPQTIEDEYTGGLSKGMFDALKGMSKLNAFGVAQPLVDVYLNASPENISALGNEVKEKGKVFLDKFIEFIDKLPSPIPGSPAGAAEFPFGDERKKKMFDTGGTPQHRLAKQEGEQIMGEFHRLRTRNGGRLSDQQHNEVIDYWQNNVVKNPNDLVRQYISIEYSNIWRTQGGVDGRGRISGQDIIGTISSPSQNAQANQYLRDLQDAMYNPASRPEHFKQILANGEQVMLGRTLNQHMERWGRSRAILRTADKLAKGYEFGLERTRPPNFDLDKEGELARMNQWFDIAYRRPGEGIRQYHDRLTEKFKPENISANVFNDTMDLLREHGQIETAAVARDVHSGRFGKFPLDQRTKDDIRALQNQLPFIENDPALLVSELQRDPELLGTIRDYEPRIYRGLENKIWGDLDSSWKTYLKTSGYSPEAIDYFRRLAPQSYSRNYYKDTDLRSAADSLGFEQPQPTAEVSVRGPQGQEIRIPSLFFPNVMAPSAVPRGSFSTLPGALNYVQQRARQEANILQAAKDNGGTLTKGEQDFLDMDKTTRVFASFPGAIAQAFREGELGPDDVVKQLSGINQFAATIGAITPEQQNNFSEFLNNSSAVIGATQFGANLGKFLDDTFNIPRIPFNSKLADFAFFGRPESTLPVTDPRNRLSGPVLPAITYGSAIPRFDNVGVNNIPTSDEVLAAQPTQTDQAIQTGQAGSQVGSAIAAARGLPTIGVIFATISAGFTIANIIRSRSQRKKLRGEAQRQAAEQRRQLELARAEAAARQLEQEQRQLANIRLQRFEQEARFREQDFTRRVRSLLESGAPIAALSQQPQEFIQTFVDRFEPQVLQFTRRPQFASNVGLIDEIESKLPKARF